MSWGLEQAIEYYAAWAYILRGRYWINDLYDSDRAGEKEYSRKPRYNVDWIIKLFKRKAKNCAFAKSKLQHRKGSLSPISFDSKNMYVSVYIKVA